MAKYYTGRGDDGTTTLGDGRDVPKDHPRVVAYGTMDEVEALVGLAMAQNEDEEINEVLLELQNLMHVTSAQLASMKEREISEEDVERVEEITDGYGEEIEPLEEFILMGGSPAGATLHCARTMARRAEREVVELDREEEVSEELLAFVNRLSSALFVLARYVNQRDGYEERNPTY